MLSEGAQRIPEYVVSRAREANKGRFENNVREEGEKEADYVSASGNK